MAVILAECDQQVVDLNPILGRKHTPQYFFRIIRGFGRNVAEAITDAVDVGIDTYPRFSETERYHQIGRFTPYPFEAEQFINAVRHDPMILFHKFL
jgi:hypothetical protein